MGSRRHSIRRGGKFAKAAGASAGETAENAGAGESASAGESAGGDDSNAGASAGESAGSVGPVGATIPVPVDRAAIIAELDARAAGDPPATDGAAPADAPALTDAQSAAVIEVQAAAYAPDVAFMLSEAAATFAPNWAVTKQETDRLGGALARVLAHWIPPGMQPPPKYVAIFSLAMAGWSVVALRRDPETGAFKPLRKPVADAAPPPPPPAASAPLRL